MSGLLPRSEISASSPATAALLEGAVTSYLASRSDTPELVKQAMGDPDCVIAPCLMGYLLRLAGDRRNADRARALHQQLAARLAEGAGTAWEQAHVAALGLWLDDHLHRLTNHLEGLLDRHPDDVLSLRLLHYLYFYDGDVAQMVGCLERRHDAFANGPAAGYVQGMRAFALEEAGDYPLAERLGREAVAADPGDVWAGHAVAHVLQMQGRSHEGVAWIAGLRDHWQGVNNFRHHLDWHATLYHLARGELDAALSLYDEVLGPAVTDDFYLDLCNAASLLLRLEQLGADVGERWLPLAGIAAAHAEDTELVFASLHYLMPLLRTGHPAADRLRQRLTGWARQDTDQGRIVRDVACHVADFLAAIEAGHADAAHACADAFQSNLQRIGGSRAQRELFLLLRPQETVT